MNTTHTLWGIHMGAHVGTAPIEQGYIGIGWDELGDLTRIESNREAFKMALRAAYPNKKEASIRNQASCTYRFTHEMKQGDFVVYPCKTDRLVYIGQIIGDVTRVDISDNEDYPNRRQVKWLTPDGISRSEFSQAALYEIGAFITLFEVRRFAHEYLAKIAQDNHPVVIPANVETEIEAIEVPDDTATSLQIADNAEQSTKDFIIKQLHSRLDPYEFEQFIAHLLECMGYNTRLTEKSGDYGVDVIAHKDALGFEPPIFKVQCKRSIQTVGGDLITPLFGILAEGEYGLFVTLGDYSRQARSIERIKPKLRLLSGSDIVDLIYKHYNQLAPQYRALLPLKQIFVPDLINHSESGF